MTDGDRISVAEREASAVTVLASRVLVNQLRIKRLTLLAIGALRSARQTRAIVVALGSPRSAVIRAWLLAPLWVIASLLLALVVEGIVLILR